MILNNLNDKQKLAVSNKNKKILVIAGAGSGKTKLLVHRIAWLTKIKCYSSSSIIAVTFTNKAANEMENRIKNIIGHQKKMWIGTFHSIAYRILSIHYKEANLPKNFQIIDNNDQLRLLKNLIKSINIDEKLYSSQKVMNYVNKKKNKGLQPSDIKLFNLQNNTLLKIYFEYQKVCDRSGLLDFGELLIRVYNLFLKNSKILNYYQKRFINILIDEFQDTNDIQYSWIKLFISKNTNIILVGDDDQSIYTWRGAKAENINFFLKDFPDTEIIYLEQNYRSTNNILNTANHLISHNKKRFQKKLWTNSSNGENITIYYSFNEFDESNFIVKKIIELKKHGGQLKNYAVLYRNNFQSRVLEEILIKNNIKYNVYGGTGFFYRQEIKNAIAYFRLIFNFNDDLAFERIVNIPKRGIGKNTIEKIKNFAKEKKITLWKSSNKLIKKELLSKRIILLLKNFFSLIEKLKKEIKGLSLAIQVDLIIKSSGLLSFYKKEKEGQIRIENLKELVNAASQHNELLKNVHPLQSFISQISLDINQQNDQNNIIDSLKLMTIHTAKGLEFEQIFMIGLEEGLFPSYMSLYDSKKLEEERRLAYVGITRAIKKLTITHSKSRFVYGKIKNLPKSRFISELPKECIEKVSFKINFE